MEDVLDVSTENLAQLKEEAEMIEDDALLRYIRIFSELSGQMKYATQKRVMLEVALIKMCRPQMEVRDDSLLERIRAVEEKLERGDFTAMIPENAYQHHQLEGIPSKKETPKLEMCIRDRSISEQFLKTRSILRCGDDQDLTNACVHQNRHWIINHWFIINWQ